MYNAMRPDGIRAERGERADFPFYMGQNPPERKDYIMENLMVTVEE